MKSFTKIYTSKRYLDYVQGKLISQSGTGQCITLRHHVQVRN